MRLFSWNINKRTWINTILCQLPTPTPDAIEAWNAAMHVTARIIELQTDAANTFIEVKVPTAAIQRGHSKNGPKSPIHVTAIRSNETFEDLDAVDYVIIIAPHEFFYPQIPEFWKTALSSPKVTVLNTEQLQTLYFARSLLHILQANRVIDLNYQMAAMFQDAGLDTFYYLPGYVENSTSYPQLSELPRHPLTEGLPKAVWDYSLDRDDLADRPIDIVFVGKASPVRNEFLARNNIFFASRLCQINYR